MYAHTQTHTHVLHNTVPPGSKTALAKVLQGQHKELKGYLTSHAQGSSGGLGQAKTTKGGLVPELLSPQVISSPRPRFTSHFSRFKN